MNRRQLLAGIAGVALTGGSAWVAAQELPAGTELPVQIETMNAHGSDRGTISVPIENTVTVIDLFATWCSPCKAQMDGLASLHDAYGDELAFISVTNERIGGTLSRADIRTWWHQNDGCWTLGLDPESELMAMLGADGLPYIAVTGADGTITWRHRGVARSDSIRSEIEAALNET